MPITRIALTSAFLACLSLGAFAGGGNDDCSQATTLGPGLYGPFDSEESYSTIHPGWNYEDPDWYRFVVQPGQQLRVTMTRISSWGQPGVLWTDLLSGPCPGGNIDTRWDTGQFVVTNTTSLPADEYIDARAFVWNEGVCHITYTVLVEIGFSPGCAGGIEDHFEVGPGIPVPIAPGNYPALYATTQNDDEYTLRLPAGTTIHAQIDFVHAQGDLDLEIRDATLTLNSNGLTDQESLVYSTTPPDAFRDIVVRVAPKAGLTSVCNSYDLRIDVQQTALGTSYCQAGVNGYGTAARILPAGSSSVSANNLSFVCQAFPGLNPGILIAGTAQTQVPFGDGFRCVGGAILRLGASSAANRIAIYAPNLAVGTGLQITPGTTWNFQAFYRDLTLPGGAGFNLTDAVAIPMTP
jgi:hypothetical protein